MPEVPKIDLGHGYADVSHGPSSGIGQQLNPSATGSNLPAKMGAPVNNESFTAKGGTGLWPAANDGRTVMNGVEYTTHALERTQPVGTIMKGTEMVSRGVPVSAVDNAIKYGDVTPGKTAAEVVRTFENVGVITNPSGTRVITVMKLGH